MTPGAIGGPLRHLGFVQVTGEPAQVRHRVDAMPLRYRFCPGHSAGASQSSSSKPQTIAHSMSATKTAAEPISLA